MRAIPPTTSKIATAGAEIGNGEFGRGVGCAAAPVPNVVSGARVPRSGGWSVEAEVTEVPRGEPVRTDESRGGFDSYFKLSERGTNIGTEVRAGVTTFLVMAYIIFLNPLILSNMIPEGADRDAFIPAAAAGTALLAGLLTIVMGLAANVPIALAARRRGCLT